MRTVLADPAKMIARGAPHIIRNDEELEVYTEALFKLTSLKNPTSVEEEAINLLTLLVVGYETEHWPIPKASPVSVVRHLIEHGNLTQRDLVPEFGTESAVSMFLSSAGNETSPRNRFGNSASASNSAPMYSSSVPWQQEMGLIDGTATGICAHGDPDRDPQRAGADHLY